MTQDVNESWSSFDLFPRHFLMKCLHSFKRNDHLVQKKDDVFLLDSYVYFSVVLFELF